MLLEFGFGDRESEVKVEAQDREGHVFSMNDFGEREREAFWFW